MGRRCGEGKAIFRGVAASCFLEEWGLQCHVPGGGQFGDAGMAVPDYHYGDETGF